MITIYKTTNLINGKLYVGQRVSKKMKYYYGSGKLIKQALAKYGKENFIVEEIDYAYSSDEADQKETLWIQEYDCLTPKGYDICPNGGTVRGTKYSEERKQNMSRTRKGMKYAPYKHAACSEEQKQKISQTHKGKRLSEETKRKISEKLKDKKLSYETRLNMSAGQSKRWTKWREERGMNNV